MKLKEIREMPTSVQEIPEGCSGVHESTLRAYHVLRKVLWWIEQDTPAQVIFEWVADLEDNHD